MQYFVLRCIRAGVYHYDHCLFFCSSLTVLYQDDVSGLEVETIPGHFVPVTPIPGTVVINIGDIMQRWTSDALRSTVRITISVRRTVETVNRS